jgi:phosphosulfolactate synthase
MQAEGAPPRVHGSARTWSYLRSIGVPDLPPALCGFDPGYDPATLDSHLQQSSHLLASLKISMACWQVANEAATRRKIASAKQYGVPACTGGGPFEVAYTFDCLPQYLDLCAGLGFDRIEAGEGFTDLGLDPAEIIKAAHSRGLEVQFEVGKKHGGTFSGDVVADLIDQGRRWLDAGAVEIVVEARESAAGVGVFDDSGNLLADKADQFAAAFGIDKATFEAPDKRSQFALLKHLGPHVRLSNVRLEEILRVEIFRRGLHSDAFQIAKLRPSGPARNR